MITADRFVETSDNFDAWLAARRGGVTATEVAKAATPAGFREVMAERANPTVTVANDFMQFGSDNENWLALVLKRDFGLMPNRWLIRSEQFAEHMATPDALSPTADLPWIGEIKTGGKVPLDKNGLLSPPIAHRRQMQWQMYCCSSSGLPVTGCVYAFMLREETPAGFVPAWMEPLVALVPRDEAMIADLVKVADRLLTDFEGWEAE